MTSAPPSAPPPLPPTIAVAERADLAGIVAIERRAFTDPWSTRGFEQLLGERDVFFACAREPASRRVIGYVVAWFVLDEGEIGNLAVLPELRGAGVGSMLLDAAIREAAARGVSTIYLEVRETNLGARRLYDSRGFIQVGRRRAYYRRPVEDAVVLRKDLQPREIQAV